MTKQFQIEADAGFSLAASIRFLEGFSPAGYDDAASADSLEFAFPAEGSWHTAGVHLTQQGTTLVGHITGDAPVADVERQVRRILSLDVDAGGFAEIGRRDPVVGGLQRRYPGLRPVGFWSPYEAAAWAVIGQRIRITQAAAIKARMAAELGETVTVRGHEVAAFPAPGVLARVDAFPGLTDKKIGWLHSIANEALEGRLDSGWLRSLPFDEAIASLQELPGVGPFSAELILLRGAGYPDHAPTHEARLEKAVAHAYGAAAGDLAAITEGWAPYRTWVTLLLRVALEDDTHEIARGGR